MKRGRPRREPGERSDERVVSYFTKSEKTKLKKLADKDQISVAELVRSLVADRLEVA